MPKVKFEHLDEYVESFKSMTLNELSNVIGYHKAMVKAIEEELEKKKKE